MSIFKSFGVNASGMTAERFRMDIISQNVANANTTRTEEGTPYRRKIVTFQERTTDVTSFGTIFRRARGMDVGDGVKATGVYEDQSDLTMVGRICSVSQRQHRYRDDEHDRCGEGLSGQCNGIYFQQGDRNEGSRDRQGMIRL